MKSSYKKLGRYIREVNVKNSDLNITKLLGVSIKKKFIPSIANTIGTNMSNYKIVRHNQFAYGPVTSRNGDKISIALLKESDCIVSTSYTVFEIIDKEVLDPEYLMMWFCRSEFDRYARFKSHGSVREMFDWQQMCDIELPIPTISQQRSLVKQYNLILDKIKTIRELKKQLEVFIDNIYSSHLELYEDHSEFITPLSDLCDLITDGKHGDCINEENSGYYFISIKDIVDGNINYNQARQITKKDFLETHKRTNFSSGDILYSNTGTIGKIHILRDTPLTYKTTCQKSLAILKPKINRITSNYLYCILRKNTKNFNEIAGGTSQHNLLLGDMKKFEVHCPPYKEVEDFCTKINPIFEKINHINDLTNILISLKKILETNLTKI